MKPVTVFSAIFFSTALSIAIATPISFAQQPGQVIVDIKAIAEEIARNAKVEASEIPLTVRAPVDVAAKVCDVSPDVLRTQHGLSCTATRTSPALERLVRMRRQQQ